MPGRTWWLVSVIMDVGSAAPRARKLARRARGVNFIFEEVFLLVIGWTWIEIKW
jgi:hypothetical protein